MANHSCWALSDLTVVVTPKKASPYIITPNIYIIVPCFFLNKQKDFLEPYIKTFK